MSLGGIARSLVYATDALEPLRDLTAYAEGEGLKRVYTTDFPGRDAISRALFLALRSRTVGVGTGIAYAFTRSPHALAAAAADVQRLSGGRFMLGLGTGTRGVRRWYDAEFDPPATRLAELIELLRGEWDGADELEHIGPPPVAGAGLNAAMLRTVGRTCDRVLLHPLGLVRTHLDDVVLPSIAAGAAKRSGPPPGIAAWCITSVDPDREVARERARRQIGFYLTTPSYAPVLEGTPWEPVAAAVRQRFATMEKPDWAALGELVPDELIDEIAIAGTPAGAVAAAARMESELDSRGIDELVLQTSGAGASTSELNQGARQILFALGSTGTAAPAAHSDTKGAT